MDTTMKNIRKIIKESIDDFEWAKDVPMYDATDPQVGYMYEFYGYKKLFNEGNPPSDIIKIVYVDDKVIRFDTVPPFWGPQGLSDSTQYDGFVKAIKRGWVDYVGQD